MATQTKKVTTKTNKLTTQSAKSEIFAHAKYVRISPSKLRRIANIVRGSSVADAVPVLKSLPHKGAEILLKVIQSATANAVNNDKKEAGDLFISSLLVNQGPKFKRFQARARGRVFGIEKKTSHIIVGVAESNGGK
ncbi:50S ribosomal protein L22 [bacterium]|jgi:large subunit ribosomal protein L22|nr:50S ribosomal protein L22 [bacterium]